MIRLPSLTFKSNAHPWEDIASAEEEERFTRRTRGDARKRFANLKVAFEEVEKGEKDKRIGKIVKKMEDKERQSVRQKKRLVKFQAELTKNDETAETDDSKVKDLAKLNLTALKTELTSLTKQVVILHIRRRQP